jgi:hypothetical protein
MKTTMITSIFFTTLIAASPVARYNNKASNSANDADTVRVQLANSETAVQVEITTNGEPFSVSKEFGNIGDQILVSTASIVTGSGACQFFADAQGKTKVGDVVKDDGNDVNLAGSLGKKVDLTDGVIVCVGSQ